MSLEYLENYGYFKELAKKGKQKLNTKDLNSNNIDDHFFNLINILRDGIETDFVQKMMINITFEDGVNLNLSIFDTVINLMFWTLNTSVNAPINSYHLFFPENITSREIKEYIDNIFIDKYRKKLPFIQLNQIIDGCIGKFRELRPFQMWMANTLNIEDTIKLMEENEDVYNALHFNIDGIPLSEVQKKGIDQMNIIADAMKNSDYHCHRDQLRTGEGINTKQAKEVYTNIGTKPNGQGSIFSHPIEHSFINGGLQTPRETFIESSVGRIAQMLQKNNVGDSGAFSRNLELNNQDTKLHKDPNYVCDTQHFQEVYITDDRKLNMFDLRYYRENPNGVDKLLNAKKCKHLVGKKLYFRSPMTCASAAKGHGICYKCYGDLAYVNREINIGQIAAENLSAIYTQILLSAKHLLESKVIKLEWNGEFYDIFNITFNTIGTKEDFRYKGWTMVIDEEIQTQDDLDDVSYNWYINSFNLIAPDGREIRCHTSESDNIYLTNELLDFINQKKNKYVKTTDDENEIIIDMVGLMDLPAIFIMEVKNNEISKTMDTIQKLINNKKVMSEHDRNSILEKFIETNMAGNIFLNSVHFEVLLMNQMRDAEDELEMPDWSLANPSYQFITLKKSLSNNRSIAIRFQTNDTGGVLRSPDNDLLHKPAMIDLFYMKKPQEYLKDEFISDEFKPRSDKYDDVEEALEVDESLILNKYKKK